MVDPPPDWEDQIRTRLMNHRRVQEWTPEEYKDYHKWTRQPWVGQALFNGGSLNVRFRQIVKEMK